MEKKLILLTLFILLPLAVIAQDRLQSGAVFDGKIIPKSRIKETFVKGEYLRDYDLTLFRSVRMDVDESELDRISALILADASDAVSKETETEHNHLRYALLAMASPNDGTCFLCFQSRPATAEGITSVIVVYMEGDTTLTNLRKMFTTK